MILRAVRVLLVFVPGILLSVAVAAQPVRIGIPERNNLQYMSLWIAQGAGLFKAQGLDIEIVVADAPNQSGMLLMQGRVDVALLQPPVYLGLIAEHHPFVLFASLLANDPINLIVRADVAAKLALDPRAPLVDRLKAINGLRIGVAPEPPRRLRVLFAHAGMNADRDLEVTIRRGEDQVEALTSGSVDGLYAHSPYLEDALVRLGAVMLVNQSSGEIAPLATNQIHSLGATKSYVAAHSDVILKVTRAIGGAQRLLHRDMPKAIDALRNAGITAPSSKHLETIVSLYRPAVPKTPHVSAAAVERNATLYPARPTMPDFTRVRAADFVAPSFAEQAGRLDDAQPRVELAGRQFGKGVCAVGAERQRCDPRRQLDR